MYFKYKISGLANAVFSTVENVITVYVHNVKQSTLLRAYIPHSGRVGRLLGWQLLLQINVFVLM